MKPLAAGDLNFTADNWVQGSRQLGDQRFSKSLSPLLPGCPAMGWWVWWLVGGRGLAAGFRTLHAKAGTPAGAPKPTRPGPGRPLGSRNQRPATRYDVGRVLATGESYTRPAHHKKGTKPRRTVNDGSDHGTD